MQIYVQQKRMNFTVLYLPKTEQYYLRVVESWFKFTLTKIRSQKITLSEAVILNINYK